jgi:hypothetical protein
VAFLLGGRLFPECLQMLLLALYERYELVSVI